MLCFVCCVLFCFIGRRKPWSWWDVQRSPFKKPLIQRTKRQLPERMNGRVAARIQDVQNIQNAFVDKKSALQVKCWLASVVWLGTKQDFFRSCRAGRGGAGTGYEERDLTQPYKQHAGFPWSMVINVQNSNKHKKNTKHKSMAPVRWRFRGVPGQVAKKRDRAQGRAEALEITRCDSKPIREHF